MRYKILRVMDESEAWNICELLKTTKFKDISKQRNEKNTRKTQLKKNQELLPEEEVQSIYSDLSRRIINNNEIQTFAAPKKVRTIISKYEKGMFYRSHIDAAIMSSADNEFLRSDLSFTLFLSPPESYVGGALQLSGCDRWESFKCESGVAIIYDSGVLHRVEEVTSGVRVAQVGWIQSHLRRPEDREMIGDLSALLEIEEVNHHHDAKRLIEKISENFIRSNCD